MRGIFLKRFWNCWICPTCEHKKIFDACSHYLFEVIAELDNRRGLKHPVLVNNELAMGQGVYVAFDQEEIGTAFHG